MVLSVLDLHPLTDISRADESAVCKCHGLRILLHSVHSPTLQEPACADFAALAGRTVSVAAVLSTARTQKELVCTSLSHALAVILYLAAQHASAVLKQTFVLAQATCTCESKSSLD